MVHKNIYFQLLHIRIEPSARHRTPRHHHWRTTIARPRHRPRASPESPPPRPPPPPRQVPCGYLHLKIHINFNTKYLLVLAYDRGSEGKQKRKG